MICAALSLCCAVHVAAQTERNDSIVRAEIKEIKLGGQCLYADAASFNSFEEARQMAVEELRVTVGSELAGMRKTKEEIEEALDRVDSLCVVLQYRNMDMYKAFAYVGKGGADGVPEGPREAADVRPSLAEEDVVADVPPSDTGAQPSDAAMPEEDTAVADTAEVAVALTAADSVAVDSLIDAHRRVTGDILALDTYESVMLYLDGMKDDGRLMYGKMSTLVAPDEACFIIVKDGKLLAVLDRGHGRERVNLKTGERESIQKYKGCAVIWLKVF